MNGMKNFNSSLCGLFQYVCPSIVQLVFPEKLNSFATTTLSSLAR
jgi:hypothetical protein